MTMSDWIDVRERLPMVESLCLIRTKEPGIRLVRMGGYRDVWWEEYHSGSFPVSETTHWMLVIGP